jgi:uncharacterized surface anchored protein
LKFKKILLVSILVIALTMFVFPSVLSALADDIEICSDTLGDIAEEDSSWTLGTPCEQEVLQVCVVGYWWQFCKYYEGEYCTTVNDTPFGGPGGGAFTASGIGTSSVTVSESSGYVQVKSITIYYPCECPKPPTGCVTIVKRDPSGTLLADTGFTLFHSSGNQAAPEGFTDDSGMITFCGLPLDTFTVRETTAPAGFDTAPDQTATITPDGTTATVNFVDEPTTGGGPPPEETGTTEVLGIQELPFTGFSYIYYIIGFALIAAGGVASVKISRLLKREK